MPTRFETLGIILCAIVILPGTTWSAGPNVALNTNGASATASSTYSEAYQAANAITGNSSGANWDSGSGGWNDQTVDSFPDWLEVDFAGVKNLAEVDVYTVQDNYTSPVAPTADMTFTLYGLTDFEIQYFDGASWANVPNGHITGNNLVWRKVTFTPIATSKIRIWVNNSLNGYSRITNVEAFESAGAAPVITSPGTISTSLGSAFSYQIVATNNPTSFGMTGTLPAGLTFDAATGRISGTPTATGIAPLTMTATNSFGTGSASIQISVLSTAKAKRINVQGKITDGGGNPLTVPVTITFRLYANLNDPLASPVWSEDQSLTPQNGVFNVALGATTALDSVAFSKPYYLGIQVHGDDELAPRQLLAASAYSMGSLGDFNVQGNISTNGSISMNGKDVGSYLVPANGIMVFSGSCPAGWSSFASLNSTVPLGSSVWCQKQ